MILKGFTSEVYCFGVKVIQSLYFVRHIILNSHVQWLVYQQNNENTHG